MADMFSTQHLMRVNNNSLRARLATAQPTRAPVMLLPLATCRVAKDTRPRLTL
jgi:hypothetical protein